MIKGTGIFVSNFAADIFSESISFGTGSLFSANLRILFDGPNHRGPETKMLVSKTILIASSFLCGRDGFLLRCLLRKGLLPLPCWLSRKA